MTVIFYKTELEGNVISSQTYTRDTKEELEEIKKNLCRDFSKIFVMFFSIA